MISEIIFDRGFSGKEIKNGFFEEMLREKNYNPIIAIGWRYNEDLYLNDGLYLFVLPLIDDKYYMDKLVMDLVVSEKLTVEYIQKYLKNPNTDDYNKVAFVNSLSEAMDDDSYTYIDFSLIEYDRTFHNHFIHKRIMCYGAKTEINDILYKYGVDKTYNPLWIERIEDIKRIERYIERMNK